MKIMTVAQIQALSAAQLQAVLHKMHGRQVQVLTNEQVSGLLEESVELSSKQLRYLRRHLLAYQVLRLSAEQKEKLGFKRFSAVDQLRQMTASEAKSLSPRAVRRLVRSAPEMAYILSVEQLNKLNNRQLRRVQKFLLPAQIASLSGPGGVAKVGILFDINHLVPNTEQIRALTVEQLHSLSKKQLRMIQVHLSPEQIVNLSTQTVLNRLALQELNQSQVEAVQSQVEAVQSQVDTSAAE